MLWARNERGICLGWAFNDHDFYACRMTVRRGMEQALPSRTVTDGGNKPGDVFNYDGKEKYSDKGEIV